MSFSTKDYNWSETSLAYGGRIDDGVTEFEYSAKQEKDIKRGRGNKGHGIMRGDKSYEGKLVIWQSSFEAMVRDAPNKDPLDLNFSITCAYAPNDGGQTVIDIIPEVEITDWKKGMKQGDKQMLVELTLIFYDLKLQQ